MSHCNGAIRTRVIKEYATVEYAIVPVSDPFLRSSIALRILSAVVRRRPMARQIQAYASSNVRAVWIRSSTVSSTRVHGGSMVGCLVRRIASDR